MHQLNYSRRKHIPDRVVSGSSPCFDRLKAYLPTFKLCCLLGTCLLLIWESDQCYACVMFALCNQFNHSLCNQFKVIAVLRYIISSASSVMPHSCSELPCVTDSAFAFYNLFRPLWFYARAFQVLAVCCFYCRKNAERDQALKSFAFLLC